MKAFTLHNPTTLRQAVAHLDPGDLYGERVRLLAGGQDLLTELKDHLAEPEALVNLKQIPGLEKVAYSDAKGLQIGALATVAEVAEHPDVRRHFPALAAAAGSVASPQIRHMGTMGGNLCQRPRCWYYRNEQIVCLKKGGDRCYAVAGENKYNAVLGGGPSWIVHPSDTATALTALGATVTLTGPRGSRTLSIEKFFVLPSVNARRENVLKPDEILTAISIPPAPRMRSAYLKFREKGSMDWAMSAAAAALQMSGGKVTDCRLVLGGVAPIPWRVPKAEALLKGRTLSDATLQQVAEAALAGAVPLAHNGYKVPLTKTLLRRAILQAGNGEGAA